MTSVVSLSECCKFIKDGTHGSPVRTPAGIPVLSAAHVRDGRLHFDTDRFTSEEELLSFQKRLKPEAGDVLLTIVGTIGRTAIIDRDRPFVFQRSVCVLRPKKHVVSSMYLKSALESDAVKSQFHVEKHEVAQAGIYLEALNDIKIQLPPLSVQQRIAERLEHADRLRRTRRYALELTENFLPAAFLGVFSDPIQNPLGFPVEPLENLVQSTRPITYGILMPGPDVPTGVPYIRVTDIQDRQVVTALVRRTSREIDEAYRRSKLKTGDLLLSIRGHVGRTAIVPACLDGANITQDTARLATADAVDTHYLMGCLTSLGMQRRMVALTRGAAVQGINLGDVKELPIPVPPLSLQRKFAGLVQRTESLRSVQREALRQAEHLFASLLNRAFSG